MFTLTFSKLLQWPSFHSSKWRSARRPWGGAPLLEEHSAAGYPAVDFSQRHTASSGFRSLKWTHSASSGQASEWRSARRPSGGAPLLEERPVVDFSRRQNRLAVLTFLAANLALLCCSTGTPVDAAPAPAPNVVGAGPISVDAKDSEWHPTYIVYHSATVTTKNGITLTADEIKAFEGTGNKLQKAVASGNVKAVIKDAKAKATYTVTADSGVYDPTANTIDLSGNVRSESKTADEDPAAPGANDYDIIATSGEAHYDLTARTINLTDNVKTEIYSSHTEGPIVQTGTSALVTFGDGPDFPKIDMQQVHTELTIKQK